MNIYLTQHNTTVSFRFQSPSTEFATITCIYTMISIVDVRHNNQLLWPTNCCGNTLPWWFLRLVNKLSFSFQRWSFSVLCKYEAICRVYSEETFPVHKLLYNVTDYLKGRIFCGQKFSRNKFSRFYCY